MQVCSFEWPIEESYADAGIIIVALYTILDMGILLTPVSLGQFVTFIGDFFFHWKFKIRIDFDLLTGVNVKIVMELSELKREDGFIVQEYIS